MADARPPARTGNVGPRWEDPIDGSRTRAAVEKRIWESPALQKARDGGLSYEKVRALSRLPNREIEGWVPRAQRLTVVELREQLDARDEGQMRAARTLRARVPVRIALST